MPRRDLNSMQSGVYVIRHHPRVLHRQHVAARYAAGEHPSQVSALLAVIGVLFVVAMLWPGGF